MRTLYSFHKVTIFSPVRELIRKQQQQQQQKNSSMEHFKVSFLNVGALIYNFSGLIMIVNWSVGLDDMVIFILT